MNFISPVQEGKQGERVLKGQSREFVSPAQKCKKIMRIFQECHITYLLLRNFASLAVHS